MCDISAAGFLESAAISLSLISILGIRISVVEKLVLVM